MAYLLRINLPSRVLCNSHADSIYGGILYLSGNPLSLMACDTVVIIPGQFVTFCESQAIRPTKAVWFVRFCCPLVQSSV